MAKREHPAAISEPKLEYITPFTMKGARGWTGSLIKRFLGEPDKTAPNPHYRCTGAPMRLYLLSRVAAVEQSSDWQATREQVAKRSAAGVLVLIPADRG
jgi:hypothetical protein